jgi:hypothetical protein
MSLQVPNNRKLQGFVLFFHFLDPVFSDLGDSQMNGFFHILQRMEFRHCHQGHFLSIGRTLPSRFNPVHYMG